MKLKPGITTTEFWLVVGVNVCQVALVIFGQMSGTAASVGLTITTSLYNFLRVLQKNKATTP